MIQASTPEVPSSTLYRMVSTQQSMSRSKESGHWSRPEHLAARYQNVALDLISLGVRPNNIVNSRQTTIES